MTLTEQDLGVLCQLARAAGQAILPLSSIALSVQEKSDHSPVTEADMKADAIIRAGLEAAFPGVFILSEESRSQAAGAEEAAFFLVDPLDGTKEFLSRNGEYTVNIALVDGSLKAGVVYVPTLDVLYFARQGSGAFRQLGQAPAEPIHVARRLPEDRLRVIGSRSHASPAMTAWLEALGRPHELLAMGSSLKFCRIAEGAADLYPRLSLTCQWDTAAAQCILECAGGQVIDTKGAPLLYARNRPILNPDFIALGDPRLAAPALAAVKALAGTTAVDKT